MYDEQIFKKWANSTSTWMDQIILPENFAERTKFSIRRIYEHWETTDPRKIIGAYHGRFKGKTWRNALESNFIDDEGNFPSQYLNELHDFKDYYDERNRWTLQNINEELFISEGHHRSLVAKFLAHEEELNAIKIPLCIIHVLDQDAMKYYAEIRQLKKAKKVDVVNEINPSYPNRSTISFAYRNQLWLPRDLAKNLTARRKWF